jgi:hypothetical protein
MDSNIIRQKHQRDPVPICWTGGAEGSDTAWANAALRNGHKVVIMSFEGHKALVPKHPNVEWKKIAQSQLDTAEEALNKACLVLGKTTYHKNDYTRNLLLRNYFQQVGSQAIYAVSDLVPNYVTKLLQVEGGTGYACEMAYQTNPNRPIYLFRQLDKKWYTRSAVLGHWAIMSTPPPRPSGIYTGIGARALLSSDPIDALFA